MLGPTNEEAFFPNSVDGSGSCRLPAVASCVTRPVSTSSRSRGDNRKDSHLGEFCAHKYTGECLS